jgi:AcrR family transcriptional regulator
MTGKKAEIFRCGKALFEQKGFKDTNIAGIMQMAGYATGSFYRYYPSKDCLFMEIYNQENTALKKEIIKAVDIHGEPMAVMQQMMAMNLAGMKENPILKEWYNREVFDKIERNFRESGAMDNVDFLYDCFIDVIRIWQKEKRMRSDIPAEMIMAIFTAFINVDLHKEEVGVEYFPEVMEYLGLFIMQGLTGEGESEGAS